MWDKPYFRFIYPSLSCILRLIDANGLISVCYNGADFAADEQPILLTVEHLRGTMRGAEN